MEIREASIGDIAQMQVVRNSVTENKLSDPGLITDASYVEYLTTRGKGWVCIINKKVVGFAIADLTDRNIWALFVSPGFEGQKIGSQLHQTLLAWYFSQTQETVWLGTAPGTRAEKFYRKFGWAEAGKHGNEIKFEMTHQAWLKNPDRISASIRLSNQRPQS